MSTTKINKALARTGKTPFTTTISTRNFELVADESEIEGGAGKGPKPHDMLLAALVSCTSITVKMYAMRKEWPLEEVHADAIMERTVDSGIQTTSVVQYVAFGGKLSQEQIARLLEIAGRCPVHKTLSPAMKIETRLKL